MNPFSHEASLLSFSSGICFVYGKMEGRIKLSTSATLPGLVDMRFNKCLLEQFSWYLNFPPLLLQSSSPFPSQGQGVATPGARQAALDARDAMDCASLAGSTLLSKEVNNIREVIRCSVDIIIRLTNSKLEMSDNVKVPIIAFYYISSHPKYNIRF